MSALSESDVEEGGDFLPEPPPKGKRTRKRSSSAVDVEACLRKALSGRCKCKKRDCMRQFAEKDAFSNLLSYRSELHNLHKLDQDHLAPRSLLSMSLLSILFYFILCFQRSRSWVGIRYCKRSVTL